MVDIRAGQRVRIWDDDNDTEVMVAVRDVAAGGAEAGITAMAVRDDGGGSLVSADGDYTPLSVDASGNLRVVVTGGGNASVAVDDSAFTPATDSVTVIGAFADETTPDSVDEGDLGAVRMTLDRQLRVRVESEYPESSTHSSGDFGILNLAVRNDAGTPLAADGEYIPLTTNASGDLRVAVASGTTAPSKTDDDAFAIGSDLVSPSGFLADETAPDSVDEGDVGLARMTLDRRQLMVLTDATTESQRLGIDSDGELTVKINQTGSNNNVQNDETIADDAAFAVATSPVFPMGALADETAPDSVDEGDIGAPRMTLDRKLLVRVVGSTDANRLEVTASGAVHTNLSEVNGATHSETNPVFVQVVSTAVSGSEIHDYSVATVAKDATDNHDYTVANSTFLLKSVAVTASGAMKAEIQTGPVAGLATVAVIFTSPSNPFNQIFFDPPVEVPVASTGTVRVIRRNDDNQSQDLYSTIIGNDV